MNNPNPFIPQGTLLDQRNKKRARVKYAVLAILGCNILLVGGVLVGGNGCRRDTASTDTPADTTIASAPADTGPALPTPVIASTNTSPAPVAVTPPPPPMPVAPTPAPAEADYVVKSGDKLGDIAKAHHVSLKALEDANPSVVPTKLQIGAKLKIPATASTDSATAVATADSGDLYTIKPGDTLTKIATNHHTSVKELMALNNLKTTALKAGNKLKLPASAGAPAAAAPVEPLPVAGTPTTTASNPSSSQPVMR